MKTDLNALHEAVLISGGAHEMASKLGISPQSIYQWLHGTRPVPAERCPQIERLTNGAVRCEQLRADVEWAVLRETP